MIDVGLSLGTGFSGDMRTTKQSLEILALASTRPRPVIRIGGLQNAGMD